MRKDVVAILQIGSLGDTVISIPCYREIARRHPDAQRILITNLPIGNKMVPAEAVLRPANLIDNCIEYPMPLRSFVSILRLFQGIRRFKPTKLYYLLPERKLGNLLRHYFFFKFCGISQIYGMPWGSDLRSSRDHSPATLWESEASRLLRSIGASPAPPSDADRDLALQFAERSKADVMLRSLGTSRFIVVSVGGKVPINDWGDENWTELLRMVSADHPGLAAVFVGSTDERARNDRLATAWDGTTRNVCGLLSVRETAAVIERAVLFIGHDTGTLHLAGAVKTPIIGIYSARNAPGKWFSDRDRDVFFYKHVACAGCELVEAADCGNGRVCVSHRPADVNQAVRQMLGQRACSAESLQQVGEYR